MHRMVLVGILAVMVCAPLHPVQAHHRPRSHCSGSGDVCQSVKKVDGVRRLRINLAAKYFSRFNVCVKPPGDIPRACVRFRVRDLGSIYGRSVRWHKHFPDFGAGAYTVTWRHAGSRIGRRLGFHQ